MIKPQFLKIIPGRSEKASRDSNRGLIETFTQSADVGNTALYPVSKKLYGDDFN